MPNLFTPVITRRADARQEVFPIFSYPSPSMGEGGRSSDEGGIPPPGLLRFARNDMKQVTILSLGIWGLAHVDIANFAIFDG